MLKPILTALVLVLSLHLSGCSACSSEGMSFNWQDSDTDDDSDKASDIDSDTDKASDTNSDIDSDTNVGTDTSTTPVSDACVELTGDYGDCEEALGWGFNGTSCELFYGCDCEPDCDFFYETMYQCATNCEEAGHCNTEIMSPGLFLDAMCDTVVICTLPGDEKFLDDIFPGVECPVTHDQFFCSSETGCSSHWGSYYIEEEDWKQICAVSLMPFAEALSCIVWM